MIYRPITVDCTKDNMLREKLTGYEHGVVAFEITPVNKKQLIDLTDCRLAVYYGTKSDGHVIGNVCTIENDKVIMPLTLQMTTCAGLLKGIIELQYNDGNIRFYGVNFEVYHAPESADIESTDEFTLLESKIAEVNKIIVEGIETSQGKSAYEIAVENGFEGTAEEWLASLKGKKGESYVLTDLDKIEIAEIIKTEYDAELLQMLGGDEDAES